jgi:hypothetical protein
MPSIKWTRHPPTLALGSLARYRDPRAWLMGGGGLVRAAPGHMDELDRADEWQDPAHPRPLQWDKRTGTCHAYV